MTNEEAFLRVKKDYATVVINSMDWVIIAPLDIIKKDDRISALEAENARLRALLDSDAPDGRKVTNAQFVALREESNRRGEAVRWGSTAICLEAGIADKKFKTFNGYTFVAIAEEMTRKAGMDRGE